MASCRHFYTNSLNTSFHQPACFILRHLAKRVRINIDFNLIFHAPFTKLRDVRSVLQPKAVEANLNDSLTGELVNQALCSVS